MGITICTKNHYVDMGYGGFMRFRMVVANAVSREFGEHYKTMALAPYIGRDEFFKKFNLKTKEFIKTGVLPDQVAYFLFASDCEGECNLKQVKAVKQLLDGIEDNEENFGYCRIGNPARMSNMKLIFCGKYVVKWY